MVSLFAIACTGSPSLLIDIVADALRVWKVRDDFALSNLDEAEGYSHSTCPRGNRDERATVRCRDRIGIDRRPRSDRHRREDMPVDSTGESTRHVFLRRARPFEPPAEATCAHHRTREIPTLHSSSLRRRPFPRSLGSHPSAEGTRDASRHLEDRSVPDDARRGAEHAVRLLLEVLDRRRPAERLGSLFAPSVIESVKTIVRTSPPGRRLGTASVHRVHVARASPSAVEVFGTYARGPRIFAVAGKIEYRSSARRSGWIVTSLRVG